MIGFVLVVMAAYLAVLRPVLGRLPRLVRRRGWIAGLWTSIATLLVLFPYSACIERIDLYAPGGSTRFGLAVFGAIGAVALSWVAVPWMAVRAGKRRNPTT